MSRKKIKPSRKKIKPNRPDLAGVAVDRYNKFLSELKKDLGADVFGSAILIYGNKDDPAMPIVVSGATDSDAIPTANLFRASMGQMIKSIGFVKAGSPKFRKSALPDRPEPPKNFPCQPVENLENMPAEPPTDNPNHVALPKKDTN